MSCLDCLLGVKLDDRHPNVRQFGASFALWALFFLNVVNFADRLIPSGVKELIINDFGITDFESSLPTLALGIVYVVFSIIFGFLSDRQTYDRRLILFWAVIFFSICSTLSGLSPNIGVFIFLRAMVGIGEAAYGTIGPPLLADYYPPYERNLAFGMFYLGVPVGGAIGLGLGGAIGGVSTWRVPFFIFGSFGIIVAFGLLRMTDPVRGINDTEEEKKAVEDSLKIVHEPWDKQVAVAWAETVEILTNWHFTFSMLGNCANTYALGGLAEWTATFLDRYYNVTNSSAASAIGVATIVGGVLGMVLGAKTADFFKKRVKSSYFLIPALYCIPAAICILIVVNATGSGKIGQATGLLIIGEIFIWTNIAPISALAISVVPPRLRSRSAGIYLFTQHVLGDIISPSIIGGISDGFGLKTGLQCTWIALLVSGAWWFAGYIFLEPLALEVSSEDPDVGFRHLLVHWYDPLHVRDGKITHKVPQESSSKKSVRSPLEEPYEAVGQSEAVPINDVEMNPKV